MIFVCRHLAKVCEVKKFHGILVLRINEETGSVDVEVYFSAL